MHKISRVSSFMSRVALALRSLYYGTKFLSHFMWVHVQTLHKNVCLTRFLHRTQKINFGGYIIGKSQQLFRVHSPLEELFHQLSKLSKDFLLHRSALRLGSTQQITSVIMSTKELRVRLPQTTRQNRNIHEHSGKLMLANSLL